MNSDRSSLKYFNRELIPEYHEISRRSFKLYLIKISDRPLKIAYNLTYFDLLTMYPKPLVYPKQNFDLLHARDRQPTRLALTKY